MPAAGTAAPRIQIALRLPVGLRDRVLRYAKSRSLTQHDALCELIERGLSTSAKEQQAA
jgi:hypothetical protein